MIIIFLETFQYITWIHVFFKDSNVHFNYNHKYTFKRFKTEIMHSISTQTANRMHFHCIIICVSYRFWPNIECHYYLICLYIIEMIAVWMSGKCNELTYKHHSCYSQDEDEKEEPCLIVLKKQVKNTRPTCHRDFFCGSENKTKMEIKMSNRMTEKCLFQWHLQMEYV